MYICMTSVMCMFFCWHVILCTSVLYMFVCVSAAILDQASPSILPLGLNSQPQSPAVTLNHHGFDSATHTHSLVHLAHCLCTIFVEGSSRR